MAEIGRRRKTDVPEEHFQWDWVAVVMVLLAVLLILMLTFEIWSPHLVPDR